MRIVIVKLSALGDIVHAMIVLQFIKKFNQAITIDWVVEEQYMELFESHPEINEVHVINLKKAKNKLSLPLVINDIRKLRKLKLYDIVIDMQGLIKSAIFSRIIPSKVTVGFNRLSAREGFASIFYNQTFNIGYEKNIVERNFELVNFALGLPLNFKDLQDKSPFMFASRKYKYSTLKSSLKNILIIPGASHPTKLYPVNKIVKLTKLLDANIIITWGSDSERILAEEIKSLNPNVHLQDKISLDQLVSLVSQVDLVIGSDTGPTHLAWALNVPSVTLFGSTPGHRNSLASNKNQIIESKSKVNPFKIDKKDCSIQDIAVEKVFKVASRLLLD
jgi:heptosyltransferase I